MVKTNKITNLKRLNLKNKLIVLQHLLKMILKVKSTENEKNVYIYYNILINCNGYYVSETATEFISEISTPFYKRIKTRKKPNSSDIDVFKMIYVAKEYAPAVEAFQQNFPQFEDKPLNIIDAGSNIGLTTLFFLDHFKKGNFVCVEPSPDNFKIIEYNLLNANGNNIVAINGAVWSSNTYIKIVNDFGDKLDWAFRVEETKDPNDIRAFSINQLIEDNKFDYVDILKIDIEGSEKQLFDTSVANLSFLKITKCVVMEIHDFFKCREDIYKVFEEYGYSYFNQGELTIFTNTNLVNK